MINLIPTNRVDDPTFSLRNTTQPIEIIELENYTYCHFHPSSEFQKHDRYWKANNFDMLSRDQEIGGHFFRKTQLNYMKSLKRSVGVPTFSVICTISAGRHWN